MNITPNARKKFNAQVRESLRACTCVADVYDAFLALPANTPRQRELASLCFYDLDNDYCGTPNHGLLRTVRNSFDLMNPLYDRWQ